MASDKVRSWLLGVADASPLSPPATGLAVALGMLAVAFGMGGIQASVLPAWEIPRDRYLSRLLLFSLLTGYWIAVAPYAVRAAMRDLDRLRPVLRCNDEELAAIRERLPLFPRWQIGTRVVGALLVNLVFAQAAERMPGRALALDLTPFDLVTFLLGWASMCASFEIVALGIRMLGTLRRVGAERVRPDLFDPRSLRPFYDHGARTAAIAAGCLAISLLAVPDALRGRTIGWLNVLNVSFIVALVAAGFLVPSLGLRGSLRAAKNEELDRVRAAIAGDPEALAASPMAAHREALTGTALLDYRTRVEEIPEWPFDLPALLRLGGLLLLPIGGWIGGALVERAIDALLG